MTRRRSKTKRSGSGHGRLGMGCGRPSSVPLRHLVAPETTTPPPPLQQQQQPHTHWILSLSFPCQHGCHYYNCCHYLPTMASEATVLQVLGRALWDPRPTRTDRRARHLAVALGYPPSWRVVRTLQHHHHHHPNNKNNTTMQEQVEQPPPTEQPPQLEPNVLIVDRIYAGPPGTGCDMWYHHAAAMQAAATWKDPLDDDSNNNDNNDNNNNNDTETATRPVSTPYDCHGGHLLPRQPLFQKGDKVQVYYDEAWWDAKITRRKATTTTTTTTPTPPGFVYAVQYSADQSKQSGVAEEWIRPRPEVAVDATQPAQALGLGPGWTARSSGRHRWTITSPDGIVFTSKKQALAAYAHSITSTGGPYAAAATATATAPGDPPWRTTGNVYLGRKVFWTSLHHASARRTVSIDQIGTVVGWISETDVDAAGQPGFRSEQSGQPARLYHVVFADDPNHPYAYHLLQCQDLEEEELLEALIPLPDDQPSRPYKKPRQR